MAEQIEETDQQVHQWSQDLLKSVGWARLNELAKAQIEARTHMVLAPEHEKPQVNGKPVTEEFLKGEISGIRTFLGLPGILAEVSSELINSQEKTDGNSDNQDSSNE